MFAYAERGKPKRQKLRRREVGPRVAKSNASGEKSGRVMPKADSKKPSQKNPCSNTTLPKCIQSGIDRSSPSRVRPKSNRREPRCTKPLMENAKPRVTKSKTNRLESSQAIP